VKIEFHLEGPHVCAWFATAVIGYNEARAKDVAEWEAKLTSAGNAFGDGAPRSTAAEAEAEPAPAEPEKPKRTRKAKEDPAPAAGEGTGTLTPANNIAQSVAQITTSPEDRKPVEEIEEAEVVTETVDVFEEAPAAKVYTRDDVKEAMQRYVAKHGMDTLAKNAETLLGAPKLSAIPDDPAAFKAAVERLEAAIA
jgi:hypothetical protein